MKKKITLEQLKENKFDLKDLEVREYLPFMFKKQMIENILDIICTEKKNLIVIDYSLKALILEYQLVAQYSNIDVGEHNVVNTYDLLKEKGLVHEVVSKIPPSEYTFIEDIINSEIRQINDVGNSIENIIAQGISLLSEKMPDEKGIKNIIRTLGKEVNKISPDSLKMFKDNFLNKQEQK